MRHRSTPRVLSDIVRPGRTVFRPLARRVNIGYRRAWRIPIGPALRAAVLFAACWYLALGSAAAPTALQPTLAANPDPAADDERASLEAQLSQLESQINDYETQIASYQKQGQSLKGEINLLDSKIAKLNLQIKAINLTLGDLNTKISETEAEIAGTEADIDRSKAALVTLINNVYQSDQASLLELFLQNPHLSDFFSDLNNISLLQTSLHTTIRQVTDLQNQLQDQRDQYTAARSDAETIKVMQADQRAEADQTKAQKNDLLAITKGQESKYQEILKETQATAAEIRNRIFRLLGGGELPFGEAVKIAQLAEGATGVRAAFILAILTQESAVDGVIGRNLGKCYYNDPSNNKSGTVMSNAQKPSFLAIMTELGMNPDRTPVSCPIKSDGAYGGAMGPAQFMPTTWWNVGSQTGYKNRVAQVTGSNPPSPFNNSDAFVATALYLKDGGAANASLSDERIAAAKYYAGSNWRRFLWSYGESVVSRAQQFQQDIDTLNAAAS